MTERPAATLVASGTLPPADVAALARLAFGESSTPGGEATQHRHLAFLPPEALDLNLSDPAQRDLGDYELLEKLGQGGMGVVYRAHQRSLDRAVALKLLAAGPWASDDFIERFRREAQSAARLNHPNIVAIHEIGRHDELNYFSMQLIRGRSLAQVILHEGAQRFERSASWLRSIAEAVDYAHRLGLLHLDLKPGNILIDEAGEPHVADFGLARPLDSSLSVDADEVSGTPNYMAPEQALLRSHKLSAATDIYGLGAILYELVTGRPPFRGATPMETLRQVLSRSPAAPSELRPDLPKDLEAICLKCLEKTPQQRYRSARELADDLGRYLDGRVVSVRRPHARERVRRWIRREPRLAAALGACVMAIGLGLIATTVQWQRADGKAQEAQESLWRERTQTAETALEAGDGFRGLQMMVSNLAEMESVGAKTAAEIEAQRIGSLLANAPQLIDQAPLDEGEDARSLAIAPDGQRFAVATFQTNGQRRVRQFQMADRREMWSTPTDNLTHNLVLAQGAPHGTLRYSRDGRRLIVGMLEQPVFAAPATPDQIALDAETGSVLRPETLPEGFSDLVFDDDARHAILRWRSVPSLRFPDYFQFYAVAGWQPLGPVHRDTSSMWLFAPDGTRLLRTLDFQRFELVDFGTLKSHWSLEVGDAALVRAWRFSPDGRHLVLGGLDGSVRMIEVDSGRTELLPASPAATVRWLEFDETGRSLAALSESGQVVVWDVQSRRPRITPLILPDVIELGRVRLSGDYVALAHGNAISVFELPQPAPFDNVAIPIPARILNSRLFTAQAFAIDARRRLLVSGGTQASVKVWRLPASGLRNERAAPLAPGSQSFDGRHLVAVDGAQVRLIDIDTGRAAWAPLQHPQAVDLADLSPDGRWLVTIAQRTLRVFDAATGQQQGSSLELESTPLQAEWAAAAPVLMLVHGMHDGTRFVERLRRVDLLNLDQPAHALDLPHLVNVIRVDPQGRYALATEYMRPQIHRLDFVGSGGCGALDLSDINQIGDLGLSADGTQAWAHLSLGRRRAALLHWDLQSCVHRVLAEEEHIGYGAVLLPLGDQVLVHRHLADAMATYNARGPVARMPTLPAARTLSLLASSSDGHRVAVATRNAVQVYDLVHRERLSATLTAAIPGNDSIHRLAFSADGSRLLARTVFGRWLAWSLPNTAFRLDELSLLARALDPNASTQLPSAAERAALRAQLSGREAAPAGNDPDLPPQLLPSLPAALPAAHFIPLDLGPVANVEMGKPWIRMAAQGGDLSSLAPGLHRLGGIDWRIKNGVQLSGGGPALSLHSLQAWSEWLPVTNVQARRLHVMMLLHVPMRPGSPPRLAGRVQLRHQDGRESEHSIQSVRDVVTHWQPHIAAPSARAVWRGSSPTAVRGGDAHARMSLVYGVALELDPALAPITALRLGIGDGPMEAPLYYAVTLETDSTESEESP